MKKIIKWKYKPSGKCPVQAEGYFMGWYFYFRARHQTAVIEFSKTEAGWENNLIYGRYTLWTTNDVYSAGWLGRRFCTWLIYMGCIRFIFRQNKQQTI